MDAKAFKKVIKQAVKEAIQEELKDILLEAVRAPKPVVYETTTALHSHPVHTGKREPIHESTGDVRQRYASLLNGMLEERTGNLRMTSGDAAAFGATQEYRPPATINTAGEGSSLPAGEVSINQIMGLLATE